MKVNQKWIGMSQLKKSNLIQNLDEFRWKRVNNEWIKWNSIELTNQIDE